MDLDHSTSSGEVASSFFAEAEEWQRQGIAHLSPYSCWEIALLVATNQLQLDRPIEYLWDRDTSEGFEIAPLTAKVLIDSIGLPGELHRDPVDRILIATARANDLTLVTRDRRLLDCAKQGHVKARKP